MSSYIRRYLNIIIKYIVYIEIKHLPFNKVVSVGAIALLLSLSFDTIAMHKSERRKPIYQNVNELSPNSNTPNSPLFDVRMSFFPAFLPLDASFEIFPVTGISLTVIVEKSHQLLS